MCDDTCASDLSHLCPDETDGMNNDKRLIQMDYELTVLGTK